MLLWAGCGGSAPEPGAAKHEAAALAAAQDAAGEAGEGNVSFHYSNKSTDANLAIDLGATDLYLEMTGRPNPPTGEDAKAAPHDQDERHAAARKKETRADAQDGQDSQDDRMAQTDAEPARQAARRPPQPGRPAPDPRAQPKPDALPEDDQGSYEDVTSKVLTGIRKAQELFYQKRFPEAMQAVRSSLDARSTAEGHALAGSIYYMQGQGGMARREWLEALRLNPDMPSVVNMLEKTRTPGGRGSPNPRPILSRPALRAPVAPLPEADQAPYPEEYTGPQTASPMPSAPAAEAAPATEPIVAPSAQAPAPEPAPAIAPAPRANHLARPTQARPSAPPPAPPPVMPVAPVPAPVSPPTAPKAAVPAAADAGDIAPVPDPEAETPAPAPVPAATPAAPTAAKPASAKPKPVLPKSPPAKPGTKAK